MKIGIICGHGNGDPGAISTKYGTEADYVRKLAPIIQKYLLQYTQVEILDTSLNWYTFLKKNYFDFKNYDYIIELHGNAGAKDQSGNGLTTGIEIWVTTSEKEITVEQTICNALEHFGLKNRGVKVCDFLVISAIKKQGISSCLIENGFIDDVDDMNLIFSSIEQYCNILAKSIATGFGLVKEVTENLYESSDKYVIQCGAFKQYENARKLKETLKKNGYECQISEDNGYYKLRINSIKNLETAQEISIKLEKLRISNYIISPY